MKSYKITEKQIDAIKDGLTGFIDYVNKFCMDYVQYFSDIEETNRLYKADPENFFEANGMEQKKFFDDYYNYQLLKIAEKVLAEIENVHTNVIGIFIDPPIEEKVYPCKVKEWLYEFNYFCFDDTYDPGNFLSLEEQNQQLAKYPHFDASTKRPKTYRMQKVS